MRSRILTVLGVVGVLGTAASAEIIEWNFYLGGDQEVPPNDSDAVGAGQLLYDTATQMFSLDIQVYGIDIDDLAPAGPNGTPIHIHNAPAGANGPIVIDLGFIASFEVDGLGIRYQVYDQTFGGTYGGVSSDPNANEAALFDAALYVNIHTVDFPGGEIRGQLAPTPATLSLGGLGLIVAWRRRR